jgi:inorganic pyrophosphatase
MHHPWHDIELGEKCPSVLTAVIEIPKGSNAQYVLDHKTGLLRLKEFLLTVARYPANWGFFPRTLSDDGDPLDAIVFGREPAIPLSIMEVRTLGGITLISPKKDPEEKIITVAISDPEYAEVHALKDLPPHYLKQLQEFFAIYKARKGDSKQVIETFGRGHAQKVIERCMMEYSKKTIAA